MPTIMRALVQQGMPELSMPEGEIPVTVEFDSKHPIGFAHLQRDSKSGDVYADITIVGDIPIGAPAIGYREDQILTVGICAKGNIDRTIPPLG